MKPPNEVARPLATANAPTEASDRNLLNEGEPVNRSPAEALQLAWIIVNHPSWVNRPEHFRMLARSAIRIFGQEGP